MAGAEGQFGVELLYIFRSADEVIVLDLAKMAININDARGVHAAELCCDALAAMGRPVVGAQILICGASYREDVGDTATAAQS